MNLKAITKVYSNGQRGTLTSVPSLIRQAMGIKKGDSLEWDLDTKTDELIIKVIRADNSSD
ncbi:hypothetical protein SDC9_07482 [bioreactor metagenome]|uniref:SpoVT-AbrB domain-containing protein n=1 Tax=bioreactor metagenome TaxID=1076179 RepID=A0A644T4P2_9ZZZZ|nr:AbrB/MazE/SpoVT family DNA-binding domain-containing protein [Methanobrevibacter sp.]